MSKKICVESCSTPDYPSPVDATLLSSVFSVISPGGTLSLTSAVPGVHSDNRGITAWIECCVQGVRDWCVYDLVRLLGRFVTSDQ